MTEREADAIYAKGELLRGKFSEYYNEVAESRRFYDLDFANDVVPPRQQGKMEPLIPPTARWAIDEAVNHVLFTPRIHVQRRPAESGKVILEQEAAEKRRRWLAAFWHHVAQTTHVIGDARKILFNEGKVVIRKTLKWDAIPERPEKGPENKKARAEYRQKIADLGKYEFLWNLEILDNVAVAEALFDHRNTPYAYVKYDIYREEACALFPESIAEPIEEGADTIVGTGQGEWRSGGDLEKVEYCEFWSVGDDDEPGRFIQFINGEAVSDEENPYPYVPLAIEDAGFGTIRQGSEPHEKFVGMTQYMRPIFVAEAKQMTAWETVNELAAFGLWTARNFDDASKINIGPGEIIMLEGNEGEPGAQSINATPLPQIPPSVIQLVEKTTSIANDSLKMKTLGGQPLSGVETATEADQQIRNAAAVLSNPVAALERLVARISSWVLMDIDVVIEAPVTVFASAGSSSDDQSITLGPADIKGFYQCRAELRTTDEEAANNVNARFWGEMYRLFPFMSAFTAMERGGITDQPEKEMLQRGEEDIYLSEEMQMVRKLAAAEAFQQFFGVVMNMANNNKSDSVTAGIGGSVPSAGLDMGATGGGIPSGASVPTATPGGAGAMRDINQGPSMIRG